MLVKIVLCLFVFFILFIIGMLAYLTITRYRPKEVEEILLHKDRKDVVELGKPLSIRSWNIGFAGLGAKEDFFMDGGKGALIKDKKVVEGYFDGIIETAVSFQDDFLLLQEIDQEAKRSFFIPQTKIMAEKLFGYSSSFAMNFKVKYVPVPFPPLGKVTSGIATYSNRKIHSVERYALPGQYSWPKSVMMLNRCMLVSRLPVGACEHDLVLVNAHFTAYDNGSIKEEQLAFIKSFVELEYQKGNYVVLGGDWNQTFPGLDVKLYQKNKKGVVWNPVQIAKDWIGSDWTFAYGRGQATYRFLDAPYEEGVTQVGVIDGFLVSPNVSVLSSEVWDMKFAFTDHNPVRMEFELLGD